MRKIELTVEAYKSCREKPSAKLLQAILTMKPGEVLEIVGEEYAYPSSKVKTILEEAGYMIEYFETDGLYYTIRALRESKK